MGIRRKARELALQALYTIDLIDSWEGNPLAFLYEKERWPSCQAFSGDILNGVVAHRQAIDETIQSHADYWTIPRMSLIDRNILRIAAFELLFCPEIPLKVSINEALELAQLYGTRQSKPFLNGILDKIAKEKG